MPIIGIRPFFDSKVFEDNATLAHTAGYRVVDAATVFKPRFARFWPSLNGYQIVLKIMPVTPIDH